MADNKFTSPDKENQQAMLLRAKWRRGPRTAGWDALWRLILSNVLLQTEQPKGATTHKEGADAKHDD
jgi:hypothetical protein